MESIPMGRRTVQPEEMLPLLKRHEIHVLIRTGQSQKDVAERTPHPIPPFPIPVNGAFRRFRVQPSALRTVFAHHASGVRFEAHAISVIAGRRSKANA